MTKLKVAIKSIIGRVFPFLTQAVEKFNKAGIASSRAATNAMVAAKRARLAILEEEVIQVKTLTERQSLAEARIEHKEVIRVLDLDNFKKIKKSYSDLLLK